MLGLGAPWRDGALFVFILLHFPTHPLVFSYVAWLGNGFPSLILRVFIAHLLYAGTTAVENRGAGAGPEGGQERKRSIGRSYTSLFCFTQFL